MVNTDKLHHITKPVVFKVILSLAAEYLDLEIEDYVSVEDESRFKRFATGQRPHTKIASLTTKFGVAITEKTVRDLLIDASTHVAEKGHFRKGTRTARQKSNLG